MEDSSLELHLDVMLAVVEAALVYQSLEVPCQNRNLVASAFPETAEPSLGHTPSTAGNFRKKLRKNSGKTPETLSERFLEFPSRVRLGCPKPYNSRHLRLPEHFQNSLPPSTAGDASFFGIGSGGGLSELVMEFPAVLGVFLILDDWLRMCSLRGIILTKSCMDIWKCTHRRSSCWRWTTWNSMMIRKCLGCDSRFPLFDTSFMCLNAWAALRNNASCASWVIVPSLRMYLVANLSGSSLGPCSNVGS